MEEEGGEDGGPEVHEEIAGRGVKHGDNGTMTLTQLWVLIYFLWQGLLGILISEVNREKCWNDE